MGPYTKNIKARKKPKEGRNGVDLLPPRGKPTDYEYEASDTSKPKSTAAPKNSMIADMVISARGRESKTGANLSSDFNKMHRQVLELAEHVESKGAFKKVPEADKEKTEGLGRAVGRLQIEGPSGKTAAQRIINRMGEPDATEGPYDIPEWLTKLAGTTNIERMATEEFDADKDESRFTINPEATKILKTLTREQQQTLALSNIYAAKGSDKSMKEYHTGKDYRKGLKGLYAKGIKGTPSLKNTASVKRAMKKLHPKKKP
jgi:hypothetical protein